MGRGETAGSRRVQRAHRILDAAAERIASLGFDKTTLGDVAQTAGVSKSTLYLQWNTREELLSALLRRERLSLYTDIRKRVAAEEEPASPSSLYRNLMLALRGHPLLHPDLGFESEVMRGLVRRKRQTPAPDDVLWAENHRYLEDLRARALVRTDLSVQELGNALHSVVTGFFLTGRLIPEGFALPEEERADLLADAVHRTLHPGRELGAEEKRALDRATREHLERMMRAAQHKLDLSLGIDPPEDFDEEETT